MGLIPEASYFLIQLAATRASSVVIQRYLRILADSPATTRFSSLIATQRGSDRLELGEGTGELGETRRETNLVRVTLRAKFGTRLSESRM